ncbi:hypothetical protein GX50_00594 [[Emmonsia] crescens]|uniref:Uncharacterized protein n=1 Tax=[Emmonsia] crescens TaxID=73230 RepID=A0A2B7ZUY3_9EURO|nr:hypothetical protein GX50_00594 [Emmonsia crescens]
MHDLSESILETVLLVTASELSQSAPHFLCQFEKPPTDGTSPTKTYLRTVPISEPGGSQSRSSPQLPQGAWNNNDESISTKWRLAADDQALI